jgi:hypothetical protein
MATRVNSADTFRAVAARYQKRANASTKPALRDAYRQLTVGYMRLAVQQEAVERDHALVGMLEAHDIVTGTRSADNLRGNVSAGFGTRR